MAMRSFDKNKSTFKKTGNVAADGLMDILRFALKVVGVIVGFFLLFTALSLVTVIMAGLFFPEVTNFLIEDLPLTFHAPAFAEMFFSGGLDFTLLVLGLVVVAGLPLLALVTLSIRLILGPRIKTGISGNTALLIWFVALFITVAAALFTAKELRQKEQMREAVTTLKPSEKPYHFSVNKNMWIPEEYDDTKYIFKEVPHTAPRSRNNFRGIPEVTFLYTTDSISQ
ncbi:MAG: hypothetical protein U5L09_00615 [Bacteroidales bacterium]|nr:hypothetical protein [Bacteroidales bacterium]